MSLYSREVRKKTGLVAFDASESQHSLAPVRHHIIEGRDGRIRRFPEDLGLRKFMDREIVGDEKLYRGRAFAKQIGSIYDAPEQAIAETRAGYAYDATHVAMRYEVNGHATQPVISKNGDEAYQIAKGKWMIPQAEFRGCSYASEAMLLAEGKSEDEVRAILDTSNLYQERLRREDTETIRSIEKHLGKPPIIRTFSGTNTRVLHQVREATNRYGPGMTLHTGHNRIIDDVVEKNGKTHIVVRDPFHGSVTEIKDHERFWDSEQSPEDIRVEPTNMSKKRYMSLLFLPEKATPC